MAVIALLAWSPMAAAQEPVPRIGTDHEPPPASGPIVLGPLPLPNDPAEYSPLSQDEYRWLDNFTTTLLRCGHLRFEDGRWSGDDRLRLEVARRIDADGRGARLLSGARTLPDFEVPQAAPGGQEAGAQQIAATLAALQAYGAPSTDDPRRRRIDTLRARALVASAGALAPNRACWPPSKFDSLLEKASSANR